MMSEPVCGSDADYRRFARWVLDQAAGEPRAVRAIVAEIAHYSGRRAGERLLGQCRALWREGYRGRATEAGGARQA